MKDKTIYVISGYMRTGTSMMMKCLEAGGLEVAFSPIRDEMNDKFGDKDYKPNPGGFYELNRKEYREYGFPRKYKGKILKCLWGGLWRFMVGDYKIVFMMRDPEEIRQSFEAFFGNKAPETLENYKERMKDTIDYCRVRKDMDILILNYRDIIKNPKKVFLKIKDFGFPIDVNKAVKIVNPALYRFKIEELTRGI